MKRAALFAAGSFAALVCATTARADDKKVCADAYDQAQSLRDAHRLLAARAQLRVCMRQECSTFASGQIVKDCAAWLAQVEAAIPSLVFEVKDGNGNDVSAVKMTMDGRLVAAKLDGNALQVDPGEHRFAFDADGLAQTGKTIVVREGDKGRHVSVVLGATRTDAGSGQSSGDESAARSRAPAYVAFGAGGVGLVVGTIFGVMALSGDKSTLNQECTTQTTCPGSAQKDIDTLRSHEILADVGLGVGLAGIGIGAVLLLTGTANEPARVDAMRLRPFVGFGSLGVHGVFQ